MRFRQFLYLKQLSRPRLDKNEVLRGFCTHSSRVCIVGSGPAGFYTAQHILKASHSDASVDMLDRLPVPFGLVRFGVAPDHADVKNVTHTFQKVLEHERCSFRGNVRVGIDVDLQELRDAYTAVVLCHGSYEDRLLNIPGEDLGGVLSARAFVGWYNGDPEFKDENVDLTLGDTAVVIGHGNVALDVARILLTPVDTLALPRPRKRLTELMMSLVNSDSENGEKEWQLRFRLSPVEIRGRTHVSGVLFQPNRLLDKGGGSVEAVPAVEEEMELINCSHVFRSIGYKAAPIDSSVPFDDRKGIYLNEFGRITGQTGLYCSGWVQTGPVGVIVSTMNNAFNVASEVIHDLNSGQLAIRNSAQELWSRVERQGVQVTTLSDWLAIEAEEEKRGQQEGKPREKIVDLGEMMNVIKRARKQRKNN
ncbi:unnamed protein product [Cyprideis torosa]|uniref:FAD/NAD(P)-binding domain-containing protein n=1 Tax=Cyprideis torosa TaxID=163714 RepID=A0A7R8ZQJ1_9CRUS|nr:unnamed protein product [Cyprideis torosa]CAG0903033.1 unnamed protein product [Cyprideis torosa]